MIGWRIPKEIDVASYRYRCSIPMRELRRLGIDASVSIQPVTVFAKNWYPDDYEVACKLKASGGKVVYDVCDNHFHHEQKRDHYMKMVAIADSVVVSSRELAKVVNAETGRDCRVISDPYEYPRYVPQLHNNRAENVLWFGHSTNLPTLAKELPALSDRSLLVVSRTQKQFDGAKVMQWSREAMIHAFAWADAVIIPVEKPAASPNRMIESIRQGKYVVAHPMTEYAPFGMWQGDIAEGLRWLDTHKAEALQKVSDAQEIVEKYHAPAVIGQQWAEVYKELTCRLPPMQDSRMP